MKKQLLIISLLILQSFAIFIPTNVTASDPEIILVQDSNDYENYGFDDLNIYYTPNALTTFHMPFIVEKKGVFNNIEKYDLDGRTDKKQGQFDKRLIRYDFRILDENDNYYVIDFTMDVKASNESFSVDFIPKLKSMEFPQFAWWNSSWDYKKTITIDHTKVAGDLTNFPVLLQNTSNDFISHARSDGYDFRFADSTETTEYYWQLEDYNSTTGTLTAWVNITSLSGSIDTILYCYYGNSGANTNPSSNSTWDNDFISVWHMNDISGDINDSTSNNKDGIKNGDPTYQQTGQIGYGIYLDGTGDYFDIPNDYGFFTTGDFTVEAWIKFTETVTDDHIVSLKGEASTALQLSNTPGVKQTYYIAPSWHGVEMKPNPDTTDWHYYAATYDNDVQMLGYYEGENTATDTDNGSITSSSGDNRIGDSGTGDEMNGTIDEIRISSIVRSGNWINTTYNTINSPSTFATFGLETTETQVITNATTGVELTNATARGYFEGIGWSGNYNYGFWIGQTTPVTEANADQNVTGASTITAPSNFSYNIQSLNKGTHYYVVAWVRNSTELTSANNEDDFWTKCDAPSSLTATASGCNVALAWTKGTGADRTTVVRQVDAYPTSQTDGTVVYNNTGTSYSDTTAMGNHQYYKAWSWAGNKHSDDNASANLSIPPCPPYNFDTAIILTNTTLRINWTKGAGADNTVIRYSNTSYPSTPISGTELYNGTGIQVFDSTGETKYYRAWSYNATIGEFSSSVDIEYGMLLINCYNENNLSTNLTFDVKISNPSGSEVYENTNCNNTHPVDAELCPQGTNIQIIISATDYQQRVYTMDIYTNTIYLLNTYLPPVTPPGGGIECTSRPYIDSVTVTDPNNDLTINLLHSLESMISVEIYNKSLYVTYGGWHFISNDKYTYTTTQTTINASVLDVNTTMARVNYYYLYCEESVESALYNIRIIEIITTEYTSYDQGVENALVTIKRYFSEISNYTTVSSILTGANGYINLYLIPHIDYKIFVTKTEYNETISSYIPQPPNQYGQTETKTFRLILTGEEYVVPPVNTIYLNITYTFQPIGTRHTSIFTFYYNITSNDCQLQWYRMEAWYFNDTLNSWVMLSEQNETDPCGGSLNYTIPNVTGKYVFKCYYKKIGFDEYEIGEIGSLIHFFVLLKEGLASVPDFAWFLITIIIMIVAMGFCIRYFATGITTGYIGLGIFAIMLMFKDFDVPLGGTDSMISGWLILGITFLIYTMGVFLWSRI